MFQAWEYCMLMNANGSSVGCENTLNVTYRQQEKVNLCLSKIEEIIEGWQTQKYLNDGDFGFGRFCRAVSHKAGFLVRVPLCPVNKLLFYPFLRFKTDVCQWGEFWMKFYCQKVRPRAALGGAFEPFKTFGEGGADPENMPLQATLKSSEEVTAIP